MDFGLGAVSYINNYRISNTRNINKYIEGNYILYKNYEDKEVNMSNDMILGLRKLEGVNIHKFYDKYKKNIIDVFDINDLIKDGILKIENDYIYIDRKYIYLSNEILIRFLNNI